MCCLFRFVTIYLINSSFHNTRDNFESFFSSSNTFGRVFFITWVNYFTKPDETAHYEEEVSVHSF